MPKVMSSESFVLKQIMKYARSNSNYATVDYSLTDYSRRASNDSGLKNKSLRCATCHQQTNHYNVLLAIVKACLGMLVTPAKDMHAGCDIVYPCTHLRRKN